jgi:hypothetical protein
MKPRTTTSWSLLILVAACANDKSGSSAPPLASAGTGTLASAGTGASSAAGTGALPAGGAAMLPAAGTLAAVVAGTGAMAGNAAPMAGAGTGAPAANGGSTAAGACEGFKLEGLLYSPGGSVLPNTCMPFHPTKNNPYAVRCIDAWPWYKTKFPGDEFCILPPPPDKGVQYGVHPQGTKWFDQVSKGDMSGYDNLSDTWLMNDGEEESANYETSAANPADANFYRSYARMRPGSHHMIINSDPSKPGNEMWIPVSPGGLLEGAAGLVAAISLPGAQRPDENRPPSLDKPQEDAGLYRELPKNAKITFNMHHFSASCSGRLPPSSWTLRRSTRRRCRTSLRWIETQRATSGIVEG